MLRPRAVRPLSRITAITLCILLSACRREPTLTLRVAITPEVTPAFNTLGTEFARAESFGVTWASADTDTHLRQMQESSNATYDAFVSVDPAPIGRLISLRRCEDGSRAFVGFATLVAVTSAAVPRIDSLRDLLDERYARIAVLAPEHSAFGRAALQSLDGLGLQERLAARIVTVDSARVALERVRANAVQAALVPRMAVTEGDSLAIAPDLHRPIEQVGVVCTHDAARREAATRLLQYAREGEGKRLLEAYGFLFP